MLRRFLFAAAGLLLAVASGFGQWIEKSSSAETSISPALVHRHTEVENSSGDTAQLDLALVVSGKPDLSLRLIDNPGGSLELAEAMNRNECIAGVNGGYFDPDFLPMGLRIANGKVVRPIRRARLLTGIFASGPGYMKILRINEYSPRAKISVALQCGPLLVDAGHPVKGLEHTRLARRTFAVVGNRTWGVGVSSDVTLADAAAILATVRLGENVKVTRAMNFDGGSSTAFWFKRANGTVISEPELKTVRDFVGIAAH
jgi:exopolysaccharide biosynthesis protein